MRIVTARYAAFRRRSVSSMLSWHWRNEYALYGYMTVSTNPVGKRFRVSRWLGDDDAYEFLRDEDGEFLRYDSSLEIADWQNVRHPWESDDDSLQWIEREFGTVKEKEKYLFGAMLEVKCERSGIIYPPFDCLPIGWTLRNGKVTLW